VLTGGAALAGRFGAALAPDPAHHAVVLFGGQAGRGFGDDTWTWDGTSWTQRGGSLEPIPGVPSSSPGVQHLCSTGSPLSSVTSGDRTTYTTSWASGPCATLPVTVTLEDGNTKHLAVQGNPIAIRAGAPQLSFTWSNWCGSGPVSLRLDWPGLDWVQQITPPPCGSSAQPSVLAAAAGGHPGVTGP
jgi:hypothetical protein